MAELPRDEGIQSRDIVTASVQRADHVRTSDLHSWWYPPISQLFSAALAADEATTTNENATKPSPQVDLIVVAYVCVIVSNTYNKKAAYTRVC